MKEHPDYSWDHHSDQPHMMKDKALKRALYRRSWFQFLKANLLLIFLPLFLLIQAFRKKTTHSEKPGQCLGLSIHLETEAEGKTIVSDHDLMSMVKELDVRHVLMRIPLADIDRLDSYIQRIDSLKKNKLEVVVNLIQHRSFLENPEEHKNALRQVLSKLNGRIKYIQVGNAYNRRKWAFNHFKQYKGFFKEVRTIAQETAPELKLLGGSVIDFEIPHLLESLFLIPVGFYDGYATQLYVDRRGAPGNKQLGFNFLDKISFISLLHKLSWNSKGELWITEFNWPLKGKGQFAPCYGEMLVSEETQANYLAQSYLITMASGKVRTCYWHQLVAPGYGLVDNRGESIIKRPSYHAFATLVKLFTAAKNVDYHNDYQGLSGVTCLSAESCYKGQHVRISALWSNLDSSISHSLEADVWLTQLGNEISTSPDISQSVIYGIKNA